MISQFAQLNWMGVAIAFLAYCIVGPLWFTLLFPKAYRRSLGKENETLPNKPIFIVGPALCSLVITIATALLLYALQISSIQAGIEFSLLIGIGFLVANTVTIAINPNIPKPILYSIISGSYHLVCILIVTVILIAMK